MDIPMGAALYLLPKEDSEKAEKAIYLMQQTVEIITAATLYHGPEVTKWPTDAFIKAAESLYKLADSQERSE